MDLLPFYFLLNVQCQESAMGWHCSFFEVRNLEYRFSIKTLLAHIAEMFLNHTDFSNYCLLQNKSYMDKTSHAAF